MDTITLSLFVTSALNLFLAVIIFSKGWKNPVNRSYGSAVASVALWAFGHAVYSLNSLTPSLFWFYFTYVAGAFIAGYFYTFSTVFPEQAKPHKPPFYSRLFSMGFPILTFLGLFFPEILVRSISLDPSGPKVSFVLPTYLFYAFGFSLLMGLGFLNLIERYGQAVGRQKMQIRYVVAGTGIAAIFGSYFNLWLPWAGNTSYMWLGPHFSIFMIGFIAYAIVKHRLMDIRIFLSRAIVYSLLLGIILAAYSMLILLTQRFFQDKAGYMPSLVIGSLLIALGFEPLKRLFQKTTERVFFRGEMDTQRLLADLGEVFSSVPNMQNLLENTSNHLRGAFRARHCLVISLMDKEDIAYGYTSDGSMPCPSISADHSILRYYSAVPPGHYFKIPPKREPFLQEDLTEPLGIPNLDETTRKTLLHDLNREQIAVVIPIFIKEQFSGVILLGPKQSGESFFTADLLLLELISRQAGVAFENARLYRTLERQMEELKRSQTQQLLQSAKLASIGELATTVAHEINNPLTSILGFTTLIMDEMKEGDPIKNDLRIIESEALRSRDIVRNLLDFARKRPVRRELTDINQTIEKTLNLLRHQAELSNIELKEEYAGKIPTIIVDADQMKQVFINLLKNAFDAMPKGGTLTITTLLHTPRSRAIPPSIPVRDIPISGQSIEIRFKDSGIGIPKEELPKIFEPFFSTKAEMGTGLGLAVSYGIIERHSGRLEVYSELGEGSTFVIRLPVKQVSHIPT